MARLFFLLIAFFTLSVTASADEVEAYYGLWWNEDRTGIFELTDRDGSIVGVTMWGSKGLQTDQNNPDAKLRSRPLKGIEFLYGFDYEAKKNRWKGGRVYDPNNGKTYDAKMELEKDGRILKMRGYLGISMFGRTARFERVADDEIPPILREEINAR